MKIKSYVLNTQLHHDYKISLLSDLHSVVDKRIIPALRETNASFICIVGDLCNTSLEENDTVKEFLKE